MSYVSYTCTCKSSAMRVWGTTAGKLVTRGVGNAASTGSFPFSDHRCSQDLLFLDGRRSNSPVTLPPPCEIIHTPLDWSQWKNCLAGHPANASQHCLISIHEGFRIEYNYSRTLTIHSSQSNMLSARGKLRWSGTTLSMSVRGKCLHTN